MFYLLKTNPVSFSVTRGLIQSAHFLDKTTFLWTETNVRRFARSWIAEKIKMSKSWQTDGVFEQLEPWRLSCRVAAAVTTAPPCCYTHSKDKTGTRNKIFLLNIFYYFLLFRLHSNRSTFKTNQFKLKQEFTRSSASQRRRSETSWQTTVSELFWMSSFKS